METENQRIQVPTTAIEATKIISGIEYVLNNAKYRMTKEARADLSLRVAMAETAFQVLQQRELDDVFEATV